jgi:RNA polymerase sigma-70 factor (ECF subfamily)
VVSPSDRRISAEIIESCRQGDRDAFRVLYEAYKDKVYSIALYFFHGDAQQAADVTQQVFLKLITTIGQYRGDAVFSTWLHRMVVNACMDVARARKTRALVDDGPPPAALRTRESQEDDLAQAQTEDSVKAAVASLPPKFRLAVLLRYFEEMSYEDMAKALNCSMGTVASRLSRGHKMLAEKLATLRSRGAKE